MAQQLKLADGRNLDYQVSGAPDGFPLVFHHGTPGAYPALRPLVEGCEKKNFKLITYSRAGYGESTRHKGRRVVDEAEDVRAILKQLGHEKYAVMGWSGGGPHALSCAAGLEGCVAAVSVAGLAPSHGEGLDYFAVQSKANKAEYEASQQGEDAFRAFLDPRRLAMMERSMEKELESMPEVDKKACFASPGFDVWLEKTFQEGFKYSCDGWMDDDYAFYQHWGFNVNAIETPVFLYQGRADTSVPISHGEWLANNINQKYVTKHLEEADGHVSIMLAYVNQMLDEIRAVVK